MNTPDAALEGVGEDLLRCIAAFVHVDDAICFRLVSTACKSALDAIFQSARPPRDKQNRSSPRTSTRRAAMYATPSRLAWAIDNLGVQAPSSDPAHACLVAAGEGALETLILIVAEATQAQTVEAVHVHAQEDMLRACIDEHTVEAAARGGHAHVTDWLLRSGCPLTCRAATGAAGGGHLSLLTALVDAGCELTNDAVLAATGGGHIHVLDYLESHGVRCDHDVRIIAAAAAHGQLDAIEWCARRSYPLGYMATENAARAGQLPALQMLHHLRCPWDSACLAAAAKAGHLHVLSWARAQGCPWDADIIFAAAIHGHVHVLQWAASNDYLTECCTVCTVAAGAGQLNVLRWAHARGCALSKSACTAAASGGHLNCLQWLHEHGCPWDEETCAQAAQRNHSDILRWAQAHGCPARVHI